jgi:hypothetical protein
MREFIPQIKIITLKTLKSNLYKNTKKIKISNKTNKKYLKKKIYKTLNEFIYFFSKIKLFI